MEGLSARTALLCVWPFDRNRPVSGRWTYLLLRANIRAKEFSMLEEQSSAAAPGLVIVRETRHGTFDQEIIAGKHHLVADEPVDAGGQDSGPGPYDLLLASLGACTSMTLRLYADGKKLPLQRVEVRLRHFRVYATDCAECETKEGMVDHIDREIKLEGDLSAEQRARLMEIADKCPVHRTLTSEINIRTVQIS
jgi:putative redox protein